MEQPSSREVTSSWVNAHEGSRDEFRFGATNQSPQPTTLTSER